MNYAIASQGVQFVGDNTNKGGGTRLNLLEFGKKCTILVLNPSNSRGLKSEQLEL
jgi:hypothetical protein